MIPSNKDLRVVDPVLTNMLVAYRNEQMSFVASQLFPEVPVPEPSGTYYEIDRGGWLTDEMAVRAWGGQVARGGWKMTSGTYQTIPYGLEYAIPDQYAASNQAPLSLESVGITYLGDQSLMRKERAFASAYLATGVWTSTDNNSATDWDDYSAGDPVGNIKTAARTVHQLIAKRPNVLAVGEVVDDALTNHPDILDRLKYTQTAFAQTIEAAMARILGIDRYLVADAIYNTANEGQTASFSPVWDDDALLLYVSPSPGLMTASAGYTLAWGAGGGTGSIDRYRDDRTQSNIVRNTEEWVHKTISAAAGYLWLDIV